MGLEPGELAYGNDCGGCYAAGLTPRFVAVTFAGIADCPANDPPAGGGGNGIFILEQTADDPCFWRYDAEAGFSCRYDAKDEAGSSLKLNFDGAFYFLDTTLNQCDLNFVNELPCIPFILGTGGTGVVASHVDTVPPLVLETYNFNDSENNLYDRWVRPDGKLVYRFCDPEITMRLHMLYEEE